LTMNGATINGVGTVVLQAEAQGSGSFSNVVATNVGVAGIYNCAYPTNTASYTVTLGSGNSGWQDNIYPGCTFPTPGGGATTPPTPQAQGIRRRGKTASASGSTKTYVPGNAVDGDASPYWESTASAFPQWLQVALGANPALGKLVLALPPSSSWAS